jgi:predicted enzyme related to lactoylglutathione lyase
MTTKVKVDVGRIVWHTLMTTDVERAKTFYTGLFGWGIEVFMPGEMDYPMIASGGTQHGGFGPLDPATGAPSHWMAFVAVEDISGALGRARDAGGRVLGDVMDVPTVGRMAPVADPEGAVISAFQAAGDTPTPEGVFVWDELYARDTEGAKRFYGTVFGWGSEAAEMGQMGTYTIFTREGGQQVAGTMPPPQDVPPSWLTYIGTGDVDGVAARATELGGAVLMPGMDLPIGRFAVLQDPTGAAFGVFAPAG